MSDLPQPSVEEIDGYEAAEWGPNDSFTVNALALAAAQRLHPCNCDLEGDIGIRQHNDWYEKVQACAQHALKEWLREGKIKVARKSRFIPGRGQQPTEYRFVEKSQ